MALWVRKEATRSRRACDSSGSSVAGCPGIACARARPNQLLYSTRSTEKANGFARARINEIYHATVRNQRLYVSVPVRFVRRMQLFSHARTPDSMALRLTVHVVCTQLRRSS
eukprot:2380904-Rhodomonas_salina.2